jgi:trehalose/maltose hydrolase-like predicted phosphorylase
MSGTLGLVQRHYAGAHVREGVLCFDPGLPGPLDSLSFPMQVRQTPVLVTLTRDHLKLAIHPEAVSQPVRVAARDDIRELCPGEETVIKLSPVAAGPPARN